MQAIQKALGKRIAESRRQKGLSQEAFADECGFHRSYMGAVERGEKNLTIVSLTRIARALNVSLDQLFKGL